MYPEGHHILIVDSHAARRQLCERVLAEEGFAVTAVAEGFSAVRVATHRRFALGIVAVRLPGTLDGMSTVDLIRARQPWLKALFTDRGPQRPALPEAGCDDFIATPFKGRELLGCVFELLQRGDPLRCDHDGAA